MSKNIENMWKAIEYVEKNLFGKRAGYTMKCDELTDLLETASPVMAIAMLLIMGLLKGVDTRKHSKRKRRLANERVTGIYI